MKHARVLTALASATLLFTLASSPALARSSQATKDKPEVQYPNSTRVAPKLDLTSEKEQKALNAGLDAVNAGDAAKAKQDLQPIIESSKSKYAKALAQQGLANLAYNAGDIKGAISLMQQALAQNVLPNDTYFQLEYMLAQFQLADQQYQASLDTVAKWRADGKRETADSYALEGNAYYRLEKYPEAIAAIKKAQSLTDKPQDSWNQILMASYAESGQTEKAAETAQQNLAAHPNDPQALNNAVAVLMQAQKYPEAIQLMEKARAGGTLTSETSFVNLGKLYLMASQSGSDGKADAVKAEQVFEDGMAKGIIKPTAENYVLLGKAAESAEDISKARDAYAKAIPLAKDGEPALNAGRLALTENNYSKAKGLLQQALDKGVQHKGNAYMMLAQAERALKNKPAAVAAMKQAALQPESAERAKKWLKNAGAGK
ncbi:MAG: tetratricopeptide repeat protein [Rhodanobacter sp.]